MEGPKNGALHVSKIAMQKAKERKGRGKGQTFWAALSLVLECLVSRDFKIQKILENRPLERL